MAKDLNKAIEDLRIKLRSLEGYASEHIFSKEFDKKHSKNIKLSAKNLQKENS